MKATKSEMQKMHDTVMFRPIKGEQLTKKHKNGALQVIIFLKLERCGKIKVRAVKYGQKQREG